MLSIQQLTHGYGDRGLFDNTDIEIEKGERVAIIGGSNLICFFCFDMDFPLFLADTASLPWILGERRKKV